MDCIEFNKKIDPYLRDELTDEELNAFLLHLKQCPRCDEELEINYIANEGMERLDLDRTDYDLASAYRRNKEEGNRYIRNRKGVIRLSYVVGTVTFWTMLMVVFVFLRVLLRGS